jgi:replicative DNA helicase
MPKTSRDVARSLYKLADARRKDPRAVWGIPWGFPGLDKLTGGIQREEMSLLMARPGVGKTTFMEQVTLSVCRWRDTDDGQAWMSRYGPEGIIRLVLCEMTAENFQNRLTCKMARVPLKRLREGTLTNKQWEQWVAASAGVAALPIEYLDNTTGLDMTSRFIAGEAAKDAPPTLWWALDYLQIHPTGQRGQVGDTAAINLISTTLRDLAKQVAPGLVLSQMTREADKREDKRPQMADLRGSGQLEADAAVIMGLYNERIYIKVAEEDRNKSGPAECLLIKQRNGPAPRTIDLIWHPSRPEFEDVSDLMDEDEE